MIKLYLKNIKRSPIIYKRLFHTSLIFPSVYHTLGGLRHFVWDKKPHLLTNKLVGKSSIWLFAGSIASTLVIENISNRFLNQSE